MNTTSTGISCLLGGGTLCFLSYYAQNQLYGNSKWKLIPKKTWHFILTRLHWPGYSLFLAGIYLIMFPGDFFATISGNAHAASSSVAWSMWRDRSGLIFKSSLAAAVVGLNGSCTDYHQSGPAAAIVLPLMLASPVVASLLAHTIAGPSANLGVIYADLASIVTMNLVALWGRANASD